ncbi:MAG: S-layer homology domain-containing protein, partial [Eubacteriales bacterium]|nr:S-layer homology domain-containing protein [Eubacteriales bacterium]
DNSANTPDITDNPNNNTSDKDSEYTSGSTKVTPNFNDVADDAYYAAPVKWAVENGITTGTSSTAFSSDMTCTRAQILTFIWRAAGSPTASAANPFSDVTADDYYYNAAIWAYENSMVTGSTFDADTPCTRSSTVTYLWKFNGSPVLGIPSLFEDVSDDAEYAGAVSWALIEEVTSGISDTEFAPDMICNRGQIVTFLYRAF